MEAESISESRLADRLASVEERIAAAAERVGRNPETIELLPITKGRSEQVVRAAYDLGMRRFGENRAGEASDKIEAVADLDGLAWDMVGHVQSRKAKLVAVQFDRVHSVDRLKIARRLDQFAQQTGRQLPVLLECNVSGEAAKYGIDFEVEHSWSKQLEVVGEIARLPGLQLQGLMTMAPWTEDERVLRSTFSKLRKLRIWLQARIPGLRLSVLSMGMSNDFEIAVEEGATLLRIGTAIFGPLQAG